MEVAKQTLDRRFFKLMDVRNAWRKVCSISDQKGNKTREVRRKIYPSCAIS